VAARSLINKIDGLKGEEVVKTIHQELIAASAPDSEFRKCLEGSVYSENTKVVRFILFSLEEKTRTRENWVDLWEKSNRKNTWTIEHIFPQGENIPQSWVDMIAGGDKDNAVDLHAKYVNRLGNLTISKYNSNLGNESFNDKKYRKDENGKYVGYLNSLYLNEELSKVDNWDIESINSRTSKLVEETLKLFAL
jgi:hypothetical protein